MGKRATATATKVAAKKPKTAASDPAFVSVSDAVMEADQLPDRVRTMLVEMMPFSLKFASDERHELQSMAVDMVEQTLSAKKSALEAAVRTTEGELSTLKNSESQLDLAVNNGEKALAAQKEVVAAKKNALAEATEAEKASASNLKEKQTEQTGGQKKLEQMKEEKASIEAAFAEHFGPLEQGEAKAHFKKLEPFLKKIEIESTLLTALPSCCAKSKEKRGTFDHLVLAELDKAFKAKIVALGEAVTAEGPASVQRDAAAQAADQDHNAKKAAQEKAAAENEAAEKEHGNCETTLSAAKQAVEEFQPKLEEMTGQLSKAQQASADFEAGPYANFLTFKARVAALPAEEAPAEEPEAAAEPAEADAAEAAA